MARYISFVACFATFLFLLPTGVAAKEVTTVASLLSTLDQEDMQLLSESMEELATIAASRIVLHYDDLIASNIPIDSIKHLELSKPIPVFGPVGKLTTRDKYLESLVNRDCRVEFVAYADGKPVCLLTAYKEDSRFVFDSFHSESLAVAVDKTLALLGDGDLVSLPFGGDLFYANAQDEVAFVVVRGSSYYGFEIASPVTTLAAFGDAADGSVRELARQYPLGNVPMGGGPPILEFLFNDGAGRFPNIDIRYIVLGIVAVFSVSMIVLYIVSRMRRRTEE
jgi:hypothetical protein